MMNVWDMTFLRTHQYLRLEPLTTNKQQNIENGERVNYMVDFNYKQTYVFALHTANKQRNLHLRTPPFELLISSTQTFRSVIRIPIELAD